MKSVYSSGVAILLLILASIPLSASKQEFSKTIEKQFPISSNGTTMLSNRYGAIDVKTWARNEVKITVTVKVDSENESRAKSILDAIEVEFENSSDLVKATTVINWTKGGNYKILYEVYMPATNQLHASMNYGDLRAAEIQGKAMIAVKYGNFYLQGVGDASSLELAYGKGTLVKGVDIQSVVSYGEIHLEQIKDVEISSKYSKVFITKGADIQAESSYDTYDIGAIKDFRNTGKYDNIKIVQAENIRMVSKYSHLRLEKVLNSLDLDFSYGGATISYIEKGFAYLTLNGSYTNFKAKVAADASYQVQAEGEYGHFKHPENLVLTTDIQRSSSFEYIGHKGTKDARSMIKVKVRYGGFQLEN